MGCIQHSAPNPPSSSHPTRLTVLLLAWQNLCCYVHHSQFPQGLRLVDKFAGVGAPPTGPYRPLSGREGPSEGDVSTRACLRLYAYAQGKARGGGGSLFLGSSFLMTHLEYMRGDAGGSAVATAPPAVPASLAPCPVRTAKSCPLPSVPPAESPPADEAAADEHGARVDDARGRIAHPQPPQEPPREGEHSTGIHTHAPRLCYAVRPRPCACPPCRCRRPHRRSALPRAHTLRSRAPRSPPGGASPARPRPSAPRPPGHSTQTPSPASGPSRCSSDSRSSRIESRTRRGPWVTRSFPTRCAGRGWTGPRTWGPSASTLTSSTASSRGSRRCWSARRRRPSGSGEHAAGVEGGAFGRRGAWHWG